MSLDLNTDSYVSVSEADEIVTNYFTSTNAVRVKWEDLENSDKEALLRASCRAINSLKLEGVRLYPGQVQEFPRRKSNVAGVGYRYFVSQTYDNSLIGSGPRNSDNGLKEAKLAQVVNACYGNYLEKYRLDQSKNLIRGLTSERTGPIAKSYNPNMSSDSNDAQRGIYTKEVYSILVGWVCEARLGF